jgi:hypothetical protein
VTGVLDSLVQVPFAHTGHVIVDSLMFAPVLVLVVWFTIVSVRDRRRGVDHEDE